MPDSIPQDTPDLSKRYWLFGWIVFKAAGGTRDFINSFESLEDAKAYHEQLCLHDTLHRGLIFDSVDRVTWSKPLMGNWGIDG
jgi:hypothetical protein